MHRNTRGRSHAIAELAELTRRVYVERAAGGAADLMLLDMSQAKAGRRIEHGEIEAELVEPLVEQLWKHRRRPIERVFRGRAPEGFLRAAGLGAFLGRHGERLLHVMRTLAERIDHLLPADVFQVVIDRWPEFKPVPVRVNHRMVDAFANIL